MKVFFAAAASDASSMDTKTYTEIMNIISTLEHKLTNQYFLTYSNKNKELASNSGEGNVFDEIRESIIDSDCMIAEISIPSVSLGIQIEFAISNKIPVLCLIKLGINDKLPKMIRDYKTNLLSKETYTQANLRKKVVYYLSSSPKGKIKFNMFINPEIDKYLSYVSKKDRSTKSEIIRDLILGKMRKDLNYPT